MKFEILKNLMDHFVEEKYAPGNSIKVYLNGKPEFEYSCGVSDIKTQKLMTGNENLYLYSASKVATVTAALQLLEKEKFSLGDPLYDFIPEYKTMYIKKDDGNFVKAEKDIKIINLFNMTAGLTYNSDTEAFRKAKRITNGKMNTVTVAKCISEDPLVFEPGTCFGYSLCHDILAALVEIISGERFSEYMRKNIFEPLGMDNSAYHITPEIEKNMATQYCFETNMNTQLDIVEAQKYGAENDGYFKEVGMVNSLVFGEEYDSGGAGIISTVNDYIKLAAALANNGTGTNGERILDKKTVELMKTNTLDAEQRKTFNWDQLAGYGYGLGVRTLIDKEKSGSNGNIGEFGWGGAAGTSVYIDTSINMAAVYAKHTLNPREEYYQPKVRNAIYSSILE